MFFLFFLNFSFFSSLEQLLNLKYDLISEYNISAVNFSKIQKCSISCHLQNIYALVDKSQRYDVSLSPEIENLHYIFNYLKERNFSVAISKNQIGKTHLIDTIAPGSVPISQTNLKFLDNLNISLQVYSTGFYPSICPLRKDYFSKSYFMPCFIALLVGIFIYYSRTLDFRTVTDNTFWFVPDSSEAPENYITPKDEYLKPFLVRSLGMSKRSGKIDSTVIRFFRQEKNFNFERVASIPITKGFHLIMYWPEIPDDPIQPKLNVSFHGDENLTLAKEPVIEFTSFRSQKPTSIELLFQNDVKAKVILPSDFIGPFQPFGKLISDTMRILSKIVEMFNKNPFSISNFEQCLREVNLLTHGKFIAAMNAQGKLFVKQSFKDDFNISDEDLIDFFNSIPENSPQMYYTKAFNDELIFVVNERDSLFTLKCILILQSEPVNIIFKNVGVSILMQCCIFVYRVSSSREKGLRFDHFIELMETAKSYIFLEMLSDNKMLMFKTSLASHRGIKMARPLGKAMNKIEDEALSQEFAHLIEGVKHNNAVIRQFVCKVHTTFAQWLSINAVSNYDNIFKQNVVTIIAEEITKIKKQEDELISALRDMEIANKALSLYKFVVTPNAIEVENKQFFNDFNLGQSDDNSIDKFVYEEDENDLLKLKAGYNVMLRFVQRDGKTIWFAAFIHKDTGFFFSVNDYLKPQSQMCLEDGKKVLVWEVDIESKLVQPYASLPTIWDVYNIERNNKIYKYFDFMYDEDRSLYARCLIKLLKGSKQHAMLTFRTVKSSGAMQWIRLTMLRHEKKIIFISLRIKAPSKPDAAKNNSFMMAKLMPWSFENVNEKIPTSFLKFEPGISKILVMNWWYIEQYIENKEEVKQIIQEHLKKVGKFTFVCKIKLPGHPVALLVQGENKKVGKGLVGFCTEINDIYEKLSILRKNAESKHRQRVETQQNRVKSLHQFQLSLYNLFSILEIIDKDKELFCNQFVAQTIFTLLTDIQNILTNFEKKSLFSLKQALTPKLDIIDFDDLLEFIIKFISPTLNAHDFNLIAVPLTDPPKQCFQNPTEITVAFLLFFTYILNNALTKVITMRLAFYNETIMISMIYNAKEVHHVLQELISFPIEFKVSKEEETVSLNIKLKAKLAYGEDQSEFDSPDDITLNNTSTALVYAFNEDPNYEKQLQIIAKKEKFEIIHISSIDQITRKCMFLFVEDKAKGSDVFFDLNEPNVEQIIIIKELFHAAKYESDNIETDHHSPRPVKKRQRHSSHTGNDNIHFIFAPLFISQALKVIHSIQSQNLIPNISRKNQTPPIPKLERPEYTLFHPVSLKKFVLLVCNDPVKKLIISKFLDLMDSSCFTTTTVEEANKKLNDAVTKFDSIIIVHEPPIIEGVSFSLNVRKSSKWWSKIPIILISQQIEITENIPLPFYTPFYKLPISIEKLQECLRN